MRYVFTSLAIGSLAFFGACQSNSNNNNAENTQQHAAHPDHAPAAAQQQPTQPQMPMAKEAAQQMPTDFTFYKIKSGIGFTAEDIPGDRNSVFLLFDPSCGHCQIETGHIAKNYDKLKDINLYFVSMNDPALMASFLETFGKELVDKPNVEMLYDRNQDFIQKFHVPAQFPANYVYGSDGSLKDSWDGEKNVEYMLTAFTK